MNFLDVCQGRLIVSCQAPAGSPLKEPVFMAAMARAAAQAGAAALRVDGPDDIRAVRAAVDLPILGIYKRRDIDPDVYITPSIHEVNVIVAAGAVAVAIDATSRPRRYGEAPEVLVREIREAHSGVFVMADVSNVAEGLAAAKARVDMIASTLSGYTDASKRVEGPDLELIGALSNAVNVPIIAEGRYSTPDEVAEAFSRGAHAVVVGTAITNPVAIARKFVAATPRGPALPARGERRSAP